MKKEIDLTEQLCSMTSCQSIEHILNEITLAPLQCVDILKLLYRKKGLIMYDVGMGKTIIASAIIKMLQNKYNDNKSFLFFVKKSQSIQTPRKMSSYLNEEVIFTSGEKQSIDKIIMSNEYLKYKVILLTHSCLNNERVMKKIYEDRKYFRGIIIDEAHNLNNLLSATSAEILAGVCKHYEYVYGLTATPITTSLDQLARLTNLIDPISYPNWKVLKNNLNSGRFSIVQDPCFFISRSREDFGIKIFIKGKAEWVQPMSHQKNVNGIELFKICKGDGAINQINKLIEIVLDKKRMNQRGLIYINQHIIREFVTPYLDKANISYGSINGRTQEENRANIMNTFNNPSEHTLDIIITSVTEAIDLDCDYVIFYEFTPNVQQMIGRAFRGLKSKKLDVIFIITKDTGEESYFLNNILAKSNLISRILNKDYVAIKDIGNEIISNYH